MRKTPALVVGAMLAATLSACVGAPQSCTGPISSDGPAEIVEATGGVGGTPQVDFPTPLVAKETSANVAVEGEGELLTDGDVMDAHLSFYSGETGELLGASEGTNRSSVGESGGIIGQAVECARVGSRVVFATTYELYFGEGNVSAGNDPDATVVGVVDVAEAFPGRATGASQVVFETGLPAVVLAPNGQPGITIPNTEPPSELKVELLKAGDGETVEEGDSVVLHYTGVRWEGQLVFDSTWEAGVPATLPAANAESMPNGGLIDGFAEAIIGQQVGSQVLAVIPPESGYPEGTGPATLPYGSTLVFVIDILGIE